MCLNNRTIGGNVLFLCVTNRGICNENFYERIASLAIQRPDGILLREKDVSEEEYKRIAQTCKEICDPYMVPLIIHTHTSVADSLCIRRVHLTMPNFIQNAKALTPYTISTSVHTVEEAVKAEQLGASFVIAGHIFSTDCKKEVPPRGLLFLKEICNAVTIPVIAIGGISSSKVKEVLNCGAGGYAVMSECMTCQDVGEFVNHFRKDDHLYHNGIL